MVNEMTHEYELTRLTSQQRAMKKHRLKVTYGLSLERYEEMLIEQEGCCKICWSGGPLVVDHDHTTGRIRGLLCSQCNSGIGLLRESPKILNNAIKYLQDEL